MGVVELAKRYFLKTPPYTAEQFRGAKPKKNPVVTEIPGEGGAIILEAPLELQGRGFLGTIAKKMKAPDTKSFELEPLGAFVWSLCDGKNTFEAISRKLRDKFKINRMEADAALAEFLRMLGQRRLITMTLGKKK